MNAHDTSRLTLIRGADVYTPAHIGVADVLIGGREILAVGSLPTIPGVVEVDARGKMLLPGLVDLHTHLTGGGGEGGAETRVPPVALTSFLRAGVTTAVGLLGTDCETRSIAENLACARALEARGLTTFCYTGGYVVPPLTLTGSVRGDIVHVDRIVAVGETAISDHRSSQPTFEEIVRLAAETHVAGMMTRKAGVLHLHLGDGVRGLELVRRAIAETELPPRVFHPTHCNRNPALWEESRALAGLGCTVDVTAFPKDDPALPGAPSAGQAIHQWWQLGLPAERLTVSSDGGGCLPHFDADGVLLGMGVGTSATLLEAVTEAVALGTPFGYALATVTLNPARHFRFRGKGRVAAGADADMLLLGAAPGREGTHVLDLWASGRRLVRDGACVSRDLFDVSP
ncbi:MAG: beta-aspartyl-peptidase [Myxococcales bacterium]|nr:beta-aspartyl-peptidase [Myxococcales bacterium]